MQLKREIKFETLRKSHKKQIVIGVVAICIIGGALTFNLTRAKYRLTQSMKLVTGTINYKVPDLRIVALYTENDKNEYVESDDVPTSGYTLNEEKSLCRVYDGTTSVAEAPIDNKATIIYHDGVIGFDNISKKNTRCYLYFDKYVEPTSEDALVKLNINSNYIKEGNPDFSKIATGAETVADNGIYKTADPMYGDTAQTYYWRGAATSNHVIFASMCWRIIRINGDGSIRLIYNGAVQAGNTCTGNGSNSIAVASQEYNTNNSGYGAEVGYTYIESSQRPTAATGWKPSNLKTKTETWFSSNITGDNLSKVDLQGKYCNDRTIGSGSWGKNIKYGAYTRLVENKTPSLSCDENDIYKLQVGAITADEVSMAGGLNGTTNSSYYLSSSSSYWTLSPQSVVVPNVGVFCVNTSSGMGGSLGGGSIPSTTSSVRPVINLRSDVTFNSGSNGTQNNPYIVQ